MKFGVITFHRAINFGAVLQTLALQRSLEKQGIENEVIDYRCNFIEKHYSPFRIKDIFDSKRVGRILLRNAFAKDNREKFDTFFKKYIKSSKVIYQSKDELINIENHYDAILTGSDQVWNYITAGFDKTYFLDFVTERKKKVSYAASFGVDTIPKAYIDEYKQLLNDFNRISVREEQGRKIIKDLMSLDVPVVLDPTLLLTADEWTRYMDGNVNEGDYILIYLMSETQSIFNFAKDLSKKTNTKIIYINDRFYRKSCVKNMSRISPNEWLSLFYNAKYIITNSFHGLAFSINFNKNFFVEFLPEPAKVNSRLRNTLQMFELNSRVIEGGGNNNIYNNIDYSLINEKLDLERDKSFEYIKSLKNPDMGSKDSR